MPTAMVGVVLLLVVGCQQERPAAPEARSGGTSSASTSSGATSGTGPVAFPSASGDLLDGRRRRALQDVLDGVVADWRRGISPGFPGASSGIIAPGVAVAVVSAEGSWAGVAGTGGDTRTPLVPQAMMDIGSITKTVTAAEVMTLGRRGLIELDERASSYVDHPLLAKEPTVRQLLCMTSGIPNFTNPPFWPAVLKNPTRRWSAREALAYAEGEPSTPGEVFDYSNSNYLLLGLLIEEVTGLTYAQAVRRDLLGRLGGRVAVQDAEIPVPPLASPGKERQLRPDGRFLPNRAAASSAGAAGGIAADAPTLARWGYELYGGHLLPPEAVQEMTTPCLEDYGLGTVIGKSGDLDVVGHEGSIPGYIASLHVFPKHRLSVAVLVPDSDVDLSVLFQRLTDAVAAR